RHSDDFKSSASANWATGAGWVRRTSRVSRHRRRDATGAPEIPASRGRYMLAATTASFVRLRSTCQPTASAADQQANPPAELLVQVNKSTRDQIVGDWT